jgi:hypothetical protein
LLESESGYPFSSFTPNLVLNFLAGEVVSI